MVFVLSSFFFWSLCCLSFFDLWILITFLISSNLLTFVFVLGYSVLVTVCSWSSFSTLCFLVHSVRPRTISNNFELFVSVLWVFCSTGNFGTLFCNRGWIFCVLLRTWIACVRLDYNVLDFVFEYSLIFDFGNLSNLSNRGSPFVLGIGYLVQLKRYQNHEQDIYGYSFLCVFYMSLIEPAVTLKCRTAIQSLFLYLY
jgi:hypothetical protein